MKITQLAAGAIVLLLLVAGYLLMDSANDKKFALMQDKLNHLTELTQKKQAQLSPLPPVPADVPVAPAPAERVTSAVKGVQPTAVASNDVPALPETTEPEIALPNPANDLKLSPGEKQLLLDANAKLQEELNPTTRAYNPLQVKIKNLPAVAKIKSFNAEHSFVELDAGKNKALETGMAFDIRRDAMIVGRLVIGETVEDALSIGDVDPKSVPVGVVLQPGDEIIVLN